MDGHLIVADTGNDRIRKPMITITEGRMTMVADSAVLLYNSPEGVLWMVTKTFCSPTRTATASGCLRVLTRG